MRAHEFTKPTVTESDHMDSDQVLQYVKKTHAPGEFNIEYSITDHPAWELKNIPISQLNLDPDGEEQDPYNRTNWVDYDVVNDLMPKIAQVLKAKPIVVDSNGWIIDGNHRAMAAAEAGLTSVPALVPAQQDMAENKAAGITKAFNSLGDPVYANLQRVALLAMQGRQSEAAGRLQTVIKDADPAVQKKIIDAVNNIKPVTINGRVADSSTLDKSKQHNDWITNTFIPWVQSLLGHQDVTEAKTVEFEGLTLKVIKQGHELVVDALDDWGNKVLGHVKFNIGDGKELDPQDLHVDEKYQGQGIARVMYDYVKSLGYTINRSWDQTDAGAGFWDKHRGEDVRVWESFDRPYPVEFEYSEYGDIDALTRLPDGTYLSIMFNQESGHDGRRPSHWSVEFYRNNSQEVTGEGDAQKVFATVLAAIQQFVIKMKPGSISFSASKEIDMDADNVEKFNPESRAKLYNRLVQRYAGAMGYSAQQQEGNDKVTYTLRQVKPDVAENFADGKGPGRPGDSQRHGIPKHATMAELEKASHADGRKGQLARWQLNMRRGHKK